MSSEEDDEILSKWPPKDVVCVIDDALISELTGLNKDDPHFQDHLAHVSSLDLHLRDGKKGKIRRIENLSKLPNLLQLNLSFNALGRMEGLSSLRLLLELNLAENCLTRIEGIFHLRQLERLNLCGNQIERIPSSLSSLQALEALRLNRNSLCVLSDLQHLRSLPALHNLRIDSNPFPSPPAGDGIDTSDDVSVLRRHILGAVSPSLRVLDNQPLSAADR